MLWYLQVYDVLTGLTHPGSLQVDVAAMRLRDSVLSSAEQEGLTHQAYWLSTTLALGAFLKVSSSPSEITDAPDAG
jgi:hypothetical protein